MKTLITRNRMRLLIGMTILAIGLVPLTAQAAAYTWTGTTSNAWALSTNWTGGTFPNASTDTATISATLNKPVVLSTTALLGVASGTALTASGTSALSPLDIAVGGTLGMQGNIANTRSSGTGIEKITIEGILRNDAASSATTYSITGANGSIALSGGSISSLNGGIWSLGQAVGGYGTISAPFTNSSTISANSSGNTLHITGSSTAGGTLTSTSGAILSVESSITGANLASGNAGELALNGATLTNFTQNAANGTIQVTGNSTLAGTYVRNNYAAFTLNGNTLNLSGATVSGVSGGPALFAVGTGTLNNSSATTGTSIGNDGTISLAGGFITNTGGTTFTIGTALSGYGDITGPLTLSGSGAATASGGTLYVDANINTSGNTMNTGAAATDILDLRSGTITGGFLYPSFSAGSLGQVYLDGATIAGSQLGSSPFPGGAVTVTNNTALTGTVNSYAKLGVNSGKQLSVSPGATLNVNTSSPITNAGTVAVGSGTMNNGTASASNLGGGGKVTLAGGSVTSTGGGGFVSDNTLSGYGTVSAPYTNNGKVIADGSMTEQTLAMQSIFEASVNSDGLGWYAQNKGKLSLPSIAVTPSTTTANWGGDPAVYKMVNSIGLNLGAPVTAGALSFSLLSTDRSDVPAGLTDPISVWAVDPGTVTVGSVAMAVRYDDAARAAEGIDPAQLGLLGYDGSSWDVIPTTIDTTNKILTMTSTLPSFYSNFAIASVPLPVPEPAALAMLGGLGVILGLGWWRRKRKVV